MTTTTDYHEAVADVARMADTCGVPPDFRRMWFDAESDLDDLRTATDAELARLRRIETAAGEVLASGQARYDVEPNHDESECPVGDPDCDAPDDGEWHCHDACEAPEWVGDLVPAAAMVALRAAVEGEATS